MNSHIMHLPLRKLGGICQVALGPKVTVFVTTCLPHLLLAFVIQPSRIYSTYSADAASQICASLGLPGLARKVRLATMA